MKKRYWLLAGMGLLTYQAIQLSKRYAHPFKKLVHQERLLNINQPPLSLSWLREENYNKQWQNELEPYLHQRKTVSVLNSGKQKIHYSFFQADKAKAVFVLVHGFNEYQEKFSELVYYLLQANISVLTYDARGHGLSKCRTKQTQIDIEDFSLYELDLWQMVQRAGELTHSSLPIWLLGHSMGGAVVTGFAEKYASMINGLVLMSPMLSIRSGKMSLGQMHMIADLLKLIGKGDDYIPSTYAKDSQSRLTYHEHNSLDSSDVRGAFYHQLNYKLHSYPTHSGSINWLKAALDYLQVINRPEAIQLIDVPCLVFRPGKDVLVSQEGPLNLMYYLPHSLNIFIPYEKHELLMSEDQTIQAIISQIIRFFEHSRG